MNLIRVEKPSGELTEVDDPPIEVNGWIVRGYYDEHGNYYECGSRPHIRDRWYRLEE